MPVCVDIDGVCADTLPLMLAVLNEAFGREVTPATCSAYDFKLLYGPEADEVLRERFEEIFRQASPVLGAVPALTELARLVPIVYLTSRDPAHHALTASWLWRHRFPAGEVVHTGAKWEAISSCNGRLLIEDAPHHAVRCAELVPVILFDRAYNRDVEGLRILRAYDWREVAWFASWLARAA